MSDTKLRPEDLNAAKVECEDDRCGNCGEIHSDSLCFEEQPAPPAPTKLECPNCGQEVARHREHVGFSESNSAWQFLCQPAPFAPAAPEISELDDRHMRKASPEAQAKFRADMDRRAIEIGMERLVGVANHPISETVTVGTWQLEELLKYADLAEVALRTGFHPPEFLFEPADRSLRQAIDAIKRQRDGWRTHAQPKGGSDELLRR